MKVELNECARIATRHVNDTHPRIELGGHVLRCHGGSSVSPLSPSRISFGKNE